jgi:UDP-2,4-diacetamido-2,4,6-trideoxy-beta-L-altropyranose hydrolase
MAAKGNRCVFLCRPAPGDLIDEIELRGHGVMRLLPGTGQPANFEPDDAQACRAALSGRAVDWLIVDHYGLGIEWERAVAHCSRHLLAIDDIGRKHECSLLLDQNFPNPIHDLYRRTMPDEKLLFGPRYALLRADFAASRAAALRRRVGRLAGILVSMGGSDPTNSTTKALAGLASAWQEGWRADVVIGAANPHRASIESACSRLPAATLHVQTSKMAQLMTEADCAIGAGGSTTWERCCLGLPSIVAILSEDQVCIATAVAQAGAQSLVGRDDEIVAADYSREISALSSVRLMEMSASAAEICDGLGAIRVADRLQ